MKFEKDGVLDHKFNDPHSPIFKVAQHLVNLVKSKNDILDVGCNSGYFGKEILSHNNMIHCDGIDINEDALAEAIKNGYSNAFMVDLYNNNFEFVHKYDKLIFLDVLEHLPNPEIILKKFILNCLNDGPDSEVIVCLPNIARIEYRIRHLFGKFDYEESGIMHQDHLRFFTKETMIRLLNSCGLEIKRIDTTGFHSKYAMPTFLDTLTAFQFIFYCTRINR